MDKKTVEVPWQDLRWDCDPSSFDFKNTSEVSPQEDFIGQERAIEALELGLGIKALGHNIFVTGAIGTGRRATIKEFLERYIAQKETQGQSNVSDYCYVHNFRDPSKPNLLVLEKGGGRKFKEQLENALNLLLKEIPAFFQSEEYQKKIGELQKEIQNKHLEMMQAFIQFALQRNIMPAVDKNSGQITGWNPISLADPLKPLDLNELAGLSDDERKKINANVQEFNEFIAQEREKTRDYEKRVRNELELMDGKEVARIAQGILRSVDYPHLPEVETYLQGLQDFIIKNLPVFLPREQHAPTCAMGQGHSSHEDGLDQFLPFRVNVLVDNSETKGLPIIFEDHPTFSNLFGKIERKPFQGTYITNHTMMKAGSLLLANGGYLVVNNIRDLLINPGVWQKLKRTLRLGRFHFEDVFEHMGLFTPEGLVPQDIPINTKVIVLGSHQFYDLLTTYDEDFSPVLKTKADFDSQMENTEKHQQAFAGFTALCCQNENLSPFDPSGVAKVVEYGTRLAGDKEKLSTLFGLIKNLIVESDYFAKKDGCQEVSGKHIQKAIEAKRKREGLLADRTLEFIGKGTLLIDVKGKKVGQVNGLAVLQNGDFIFGKPSRITAQCFLGKGEVINIERESKMSGPNFDKAVLILRGYLGDKYAQGKPLSFLSISLCFEQSYGQIEGDSASVGELAAIISSLSGLPVNQGLAITGSMNQMGEVQPIGGVNEKIEGFFDACQEIGLSGGQGVIIPKRNLGNLMLREDVVEACKKWQFRIYAVDAVEEALELLLGKKAGQRDQAGNYPPDSINSLVESRLAKMAELSKKAGSPANSGGGGLKKLLKWFSDWLSRF